MTYKEQLKGKKLEIKSAKIVCPDGELMNLELVNDNNTIAPIYSVNPGPTISVLDTIQEKLRKEWRRDINRLLWKHGGKR